MYKLIINRHAQSEFAKEIRYSHKKWGRQHAQKYKAELETKIYALEDNPFIYPIRNEISDRLRMFTHKGSNVVYTVEDIRKEIIILAIQSVYKDISPNLMDRLRDT